MDVKTVIDELWDIYNCEDGCPDCAHVRERLDFLKNEFRRISAKEAYCPIATGVCGGCPYAKKQEDDDDQQNQGRLPARL